MTRIGQSDYRCDRFDRRSIRVIAYALVGLGSLLAGGSVLAADSASKASSAEAAPAGASLAGAAIDQPHGPNTLVAEGLVQNLRAKTDRELTALTAQWGQLSSSERRILLAEVRNRMQLRQVSQARPRVRVTRRYGRIVRKPDGSVVVQTQVVTPSTQNSSNPATDVQQVITHNQVRRQGRITFGFGFERRGARRAPDTTTRHTAGTTSDVVPLENTPPPAVKAE